MSKKKVQKNDSQFSKTVGKKTAGRNKDGVIIMNKSAGDLVDESRKTATKNKKLAPYITKVYPDEE